MAGGHVDGHHLAASPERTLAQGDEGCREVDGLEIDTAPDAVLSDRREVFGETDGFQSEAGIEGIVADGHHSVVVVVREHHDVPYLRVHVERAGADGVLAVAA